MATRATLRQVRPLALIVTDSCPLKLLTMLVTMTLLAVTLMCDSAAQRRPV